MISESSELMKAISAHNEEKLVHPLSYTMLEIMH